MKQLTAILLAAALGACGGSASTVSGGEEIEGWRVDAQGQDVFYMRMPGAASRNAVDQDNRAMMKSTCIDATKLQALDNIVRKMIGETIQGQSGTMDGQSTGTVITSVRNGLIKGTSMGECAPTDREKNYAQCECIHFVSGKGLKKKFELAVEQAAKK